MSRRPSRRTVERLLGGLLVAQLAAASAALVTLPRSPSPALPAPPDTGTVTNARPEAGARLAAVRALLQRRAAAVLRRDASAFLATVDPQASGFRARQAAYIDALRDVPLASWTYVLDAGRERPHTPELDRQHGTWWAPDVTLRYALSGFDRQPTLQPQGLTFVLREGRWYVAADDDFAATGRRTSRDLWDGGRVVVARGAACLVMGHPLRVALVQQLVGECDRAVPRVSAVWGERWARRVVVLVPDTTEELARIVPEAGDLTQIAAVATAELVAPSTGYHPVVDRVLVNPVTFPQLGPLGRRVVVTHEVTHVASRQATGPHVPTWLVEGFADYVGYRGTSLPVRSAAQELLGDVRAGRVPTALPDDDDFDASNADLAQTYEMSWLAVRAVAGRYGEDGLLRLYRRAGSSTDFAAALRAELGLSLPALTALWRAHLVRELG